MTDWKKVVDSNSGRSYYFNKTTKLTSWVRPDDYFSEGEEEIQKNDPQNIEENTPTTQNAWKEMQQADGMNYYYNTVTHETTWETPVELQYPSDEGKDKS